MQHNLPDNVVAKIARRFGLEPTDRLVVESAEQARGYHGQPTTPGSWGATNGRCDARKLFTGYLEEETYVARCEARAHDAFCRDAYGEG